MAAAPSVRRRRLGAELRRLRSQRDLTADQVAALLDWSTSKISRVETAKIGISVSDVRLLLELYGVAGQHKSELLALADAATRRGWWARYSKDLIFAEFAAYVALEDEADSAANHVTYNIPGLLQIEEYAYHIIEGGRSAFQGISQAQADRLVEVRMRRQQILYREQPLHFSSVLDESVLMRAIGNRGTMRRQLTQLIELAERPNIELRIHPLKAAHVPVFNESFTILNFLPAHDVNFPEVLFIDSVQSAEVLDTGITRHYRLAWESIKASSLPPQKSRERIAEAVKEL
ncbi:helix-turn-helix transcriptional regulator [Spirillospora sp. NPDC049024]